MAGGLFAGMSLASWSQPDTVTKYAKRLGTSVLLDYGVSRVGTGYLFTAQAMGVSRDSTLAQLSEAANGAADVPMAVQRLGQRLREQLVDARRELPRTKSRSLNDVSLAAIERYSAARVEFSKRNYVEAARLALQAVTIDSTYLDGWLGRRAALANAGVNSGGQLEALGRAYALRDRERSPLDRLDLEVTYWEARSDLPRALVNAIAPAGISPYMQQGAAGSNAPGTGCPAAEGRRLGDALRQ